MDIRNFFGGGGSKASKTKANAKSPPPKPSRKRSSNVMKEKETKEKAPKEETKESKLKTGDTDLIKSSPLKKSKRDSTVTTPNQSKKIKRKRPPVEESDHESDDNDDDFQPKIKPKQTPKKSPKKRKASSKTPPSLLSKPSQPVASYPQEEATPNILANLTFCITGQLTSLSREDATEYIKILGGRVTTGVSGKTSYLLAGETLEDGREVHEGKKYKRAQDLNTIILNGEEEMYGLVKTLDDNLKGSLNGTTVADTEVKSKGGVPHVVKNPYASNSTPKNPYASSSSTTPPKNPYTNSAAPKNPYAKNPYSSKPSAATSTSTPKETISGGGRAKMDPNALWADKYAPNSSRGILGNADNVRKLSSWLKSWENTFLNESTKFHPQKGPFKAALLSGPPGIGKTTTAVLVANECGRQVLELNASDARSKKSLETMGLGAVAGSQVLTFSAKEMDSSKRCIIMDEVDGMGAGDRSGMTELLKIIKASMVPIICICNDRQSQKLKSLATYCLDLRYRRPVKSVIARRALEVASAEGMMVEINAAEAVVESCGNDIRQVLNCLQMWSNKRHVSNDKKSSMTYKDYKDRSNLINKDEMLRVSMFDATKLLVEGRRGLSNNDPKANLDNFMKRNNAFFVDYSLMGMMVHQNYLKVMTNSYNKVKIAANDEAEQSFFQEMCKATETMSDYAVAEHSVRGGDQNWGLLPYSAALVVKTGHHAGGEAGGFLPGFPQFASWLGKNSSRTKKIRLLQEVNHHMNYKVSCDSTGLRLEYLPVLRQKILGLMTDSEGPHVSEVIELMDEYGLDRDDIFESMDELNLDSTSKNFGDLESKVKASFTREYNKGIHKSQALVDEQGVSTRRKKKSSADEGEGNDDGSDDEEEENLEELQKLFKKKGRGGKARGKKSKKKT